LASGRTFDRVVIEGTPGDSFNRYPSAPLKVRPHFRALGPAAGIERDMVAAMVVAAIDQPSRTPEARISPKVIFCGVGVMVVYSIVKVALLGCCMGC
jgi:hypothetical protein